MSRASRGSSDPPTSRADRCRCSSRATGDAARIFVVFDEEPLGAKAIADLRRVQSRVPDLVDSAGLRGVHVSYAGDTPLAQETVDAIRSDGIRVGIAVLLVELRVARALSPCDRGRRSTCSERACWHSPRARCDDLGRWQASCSHDDLTYYVPFAAGVLLLSLGSTTTCSSSGRSGSRPASGLSARRDRRRGAAHLVDDHDGRPHVSRAASHCSRSCRSAPCASSRSRWRSASSSTRSSCAAFSCRRCSRSSGDASAPGVEAARGARVAIAAARAPSTGVRAAVRRQSHLVLQGRPSATCIATDERSLLDRRARC